MRAELLRSARLFVDETIAPVLDPGRGSVKKGYLWTIARNDSGHGGADPSAVVYTYAPGRGGQHARQLLEPFHGIIQCDGYGAYKQFADPKRARSIGPPNTLAFCWAHCRRKFYEIAKAGNAPIADEALIRIAALYAIEKSIRGQSCDIRRAARQERSKPLVKSLRLWLIGQAAKTVRASKLAEAITYVLNHWKGLTQFLHDGRIEMDNTAAERMIRPITLNRKNALFAGNDLGGENWAAVASIIETCKLCHINPQAYLTDILIKLASRWPNSRIDEIMPYNWKTEAVPATSDALAA